MAISIKAPKDFWTGVLFISFGGAGLLFGTNLSMGTASQMGAGYFPKVLSALLVLIGIVSLFRSTAHVGEPVGGLAIRPLLLVLGAIAAYAWLLPRIGFALSLLVLCVVSAAASDQFKFDAKVALGLVLLIVACALVFVEALGVPIPLLGRWLDSVIGPLVPWLR